MAQLSITIKHVCLPLVSLGTWVFAIKAWAVSATSAWATYPDTQWKEGLMQKAEGGDRVNMLPWEKWTQMVQGPQVCLWALAGRRVKGRVREMHTTAVLVENENSWKEAVSTETDWLESQSCGETGMLQIQRLISFSHASLAPRAAVPSTHLCLK